jgi:PAS domain S-box-containing protein
LIRFGPSRVLPYAIAVAAVVAATALKMALDPALGRDAPGLSYFGAIIVSAWYGGFGPGLVATVLATGAVTSVFLPSYHGFSIGGFAGPVVVGIFVVEGVVIAALAAGLHAARRGVITRQRQLEAIVDATAAVVYLKSLDGRYLLVNNRFAQLFHVRVNDLLGKTSHDVFPREMADRFRANDRAAEQAGRPLQFEETVPHDDGLHTYVSIKFPVRDDRGIYAVCGISTDITERKRAEEELAIRARQQAAIAALGQQALAEPDLGRLLQSATQLVAETLGIELCGMFELAPTGDACVLRTGVGWTQESLGVATIPSNPRSLITLTLTTGQTVAVADVATHDEATHAPLFDAHGVVSMLAARVRGPGQAIAVLAACGKTPRRFSANDVHFIEASAHVLGQAIARHHAERSVEGQRESLRVTLASIGDAVIATDTDGRITFMNPVAARLTGWSAEAASGTPLPTVFTIVDEDTGRPVESPVERIMRDGHASGSASRALLVAKDGRRTPIDDSGAPIRSASGTVVGVVLVFHDVTERRRDEAERGRLLEHAEAARIAAEAAERRAQFLAEASTIVASSLDHEATLAKVAQLAVPALADVAFVDVLDDDGSLHRVPVAHVDSVPADLARRLQAFPPHPSRTDTLSDVLRTARPVLGSSLSDADVAAAAATPAHLAVLRELGVTSWIVVPLVARGQSLGVMTMLRTRGAQGYERADLETVEDLARRVASAVDNARLYRMAERQRREAEVIVELARAINVSLDLATILQRVTEAAHELCGCDRAAAALRDADSDAMVVRYRAGGGQAGSEAIRIEPGRGAGGQVLATGRPVRTPAGVSAASDGSRPEPDPDAAATLVVPIAIGDRIEGLLYASHRTARAFSDRDEAILLRLAEHAAIAIRNVQLLARAEGARVDAEAANRMKDEFLATLSHELRTPLTAMLGWARLMRTGALEPAIVERALETIERNASVQTQLIEDLLDVSRIITGKLKLDIRPVLLGPVVEAAVDAVRLAADAKELTLEVAIDPAVGTVVGDPDRLQQVVWNLLSNAIKFTPRSGRVHLALVRSERYAEIRVSDTGRGITAEFIPFLFERFRQADGGNTRGHGGLGLGLAIVRHVVEMHGGTVRAESPGAGKGATFIVELPLASPFAAPMKILPAASTGSGAPPEMPSLRGIRAVVVDDETDARELVATILQETGARVTVAASAREALSVITDEEPPDVLIADVGMPDEDGYWLIRHVRVLDTARGTRVPAIALTAYARTEDRLRLLAAGFQIHVPKPVDPIELATVVAAVVGRSATLGET